MVMGIDPGLSGGMAMVEGGAVRDLVVMPIYSGWEYKLLDMPQLLYEIELMANDAGRIVIEEMFAFRSGTHRTTNTEFKIGVNYGIILGILQHWDYKLHFVRANAWQAKMYGPYRLRKDLSKKHKSIKSAELHFPGVKFWVKPQRSPQDGLCDAALIAKYGEMHYG